MPKKRAVKYLLIALPLLALTGLIGFRVFQAVKSKDQQGAAGSGGGLPSVRLERGLYVYLAGEVGAWLAARKSGPGATVSHAEKGVSAP